MKLKFNRLLNISVILITTFLCTKRANASSISEALKSADKPAGDLSGAYENLTGIVYLIIAFGGFWIVGMLVWGGMTLAGSGGNPQKRTEGFVKLSLTIVGAYIIYKSYDIAGLAMSFK